MKMRATKMHSTTPLSAIALPLLLLMAACAGDLKDAQQSANKAAAFVGDMQQTTASAIANQQAVHKMERLRIAELQATGQMHMAGSSQYRALWSAAGLKDSQELYKALADLTADADLTKSAPFVVITPPPAFIAPAIDREKFTALIAKLNKLAEGVSPIERAKALAPFIEVVIASYAESIKASKEQKPLVAAAGSMALPTGTANVLGNFEAKDRSVDAPSTQIEALDSNFVPITGLLSTLVVQ